MGSKKARKPLFPPKFKVGDRVRVRHGVKDVDYPDMPMGGWAGSVIEVSGADTFTIRWNKETLEAIGTMPTAGFAINSWKPNSATAGRWTRRSARCRKALPGRTRLRIE
jgi:hypothetical protein